MSNFRNYVSNTSDKIGNFLNSGSIVANIAFLFLVIIIFIILLRVGVNIISWLFSPSGSIHLIDGMIDAKHSQHFPQDPNDKDAKTIVRSKNQMHGIEFTWSVWINIEDLQYHSSNYKHIFHKGGDKINYSDTSSGAAGLNQGTNGPGLYIMPDKNDLLLVMDTFNKGQEKIQIPNIPLNKWINIMVRCENLIIDVYVNGTISQRRKCKEVPYQNYGDVYTTSNGGFSGYLSNLWYWNHALAPTTIQNIVRNGPNLNLKHKNHNQPKDNEPAYFSLRWFFTNNDPDYGGL